MIEKQFESNWKGTEERLESKENIIGQNYFPIEIENEMHSYSSQETKESIM